MSSSLESECAVAGYSTKTFSAWSLPFGVNNEYNTILSGIEEQLATQ
jgi:hypothetical protein